MRQIDAQSAACPASAAAAREGVAASCGGKARGAPTGECLRRSNNRARGGAAGSGSDSSGNGRHVSGPNADNGSCSWGCVAGDGSESCGGAAGDEGASCGGDGGSDAGDGKQSNGGDAAADGGGVGSDGVGPAVDGRVAEGDRREAVDDNCGEATVSASSSGVADDGGVEDADACCAVPGEAAEMAAATPLFIIVLYSNTVSCHEVWDSDSPEVDMKKKTAEAENLDR